MDTETPASDHGHHEMTTIYTIAGGNREDHGQALVASQEELEPSNSMSALHASVLKYVSRRQIAGVLLLISLGFVLICGWFTGVFVHRKNVNSSVWAFLAGAVSCGMLSLHVLYVTRKLESWHNRKTLESIKVFAMIMCIITGISLCCYLILGFLRKHTLETQGENCLVAGMFSGICFGFSILLYFTAQWFQNFMPIIAPPAFMIPEVDPSIQATST